MFINLLFPNRIKKDGRSSKMAWIFFSIPSIIWIIYKFKNGESLSQIFFSGSPLFLVFALLSSLVYIFYDDFISLFVNKDVRNFKKLLPRIERLLELYDIEKPLQNKETIILLTDLHNSLYMLGVHFSIEIGYWDDKYEKNEKNFKIMNIFMLEIFSWLKPLCEKGDLKNARERNNKPDIEYCNNGFIIRNSSMNSFNQTPEQNLIKKKYI